MAELRNYGPVAGIQIEHSLVERSAERELLPMAEALGIGAALYSPLGGGLLSGTHRAGGTGARKMVVYREDREERSRILDAVLDVANGLGATPSQVAVAWQRALDARSTTALVTIIGPRTLAQADDYLGALDVELSEEQYAQLRDASVLDMGVPFDGVGGPPDAGDRQRLGPRAVPVN